MKKIITITFIVSIGFLMITSVWNAPVYFDKGSSWYHLLWSIGAIGIGAFATFFTSSFNKGNANSFEKLHKQTGFTLFKKMAEGTLEDDQRIVTIGVGIIFVVIGLIIFFRYLTQL